MGLQYDKYKFLRTPLNDTEFNKRWRDLDLRLHSLEQGIAAVDGAVDSLVAKGLADLSEQIAESVDLLSSDVQSASATLAILDASLDILETQFNNIINGGGIPASAVSVVAIPEVAGTDAQTVLENLKAAIDAVEAQIPEIPETVGTIVVADTTARDALTGLQAGEMVHVLDNGSAKWARYQITATGDGTWAGASKTLIYTQDQAPAAHTQAMDTIIGLVTALSGKASTGHTHAIDDVSGLQTALDAKIGVSRTVATSGLATGGGDLSANRTIDVPKAAAADFKSGTNDDKALTAKSVFDAAAPTALTGATTITVDFTNINFTLAMTSSGWTLGAPTGGKVGQSGWIRIVQDGAGNRTLSYNSAWKFPGGTDPVLSTASNAVDYLFYVVGPSGEIIASLNKDFK